MSVLYKDIPSFDPCDVANTALWKHFCAKYKSVFDCDPTFMWTEAEVVYWLDNKYNTLKYISLQKYI